MYKLRKKRLKTGKTDAKIENVNREMNIFKRTK